MNEDDVVAPKNPMEWPKRARYFPALYFLGRFLANLVAQFGRSEDLCSLAARDRGEGQRSTEG